jgi:hypothetical protein
MFGSWSSSLGALASSEFEYSAAHVLERRLSEHKPGDGRRDLVGQTEPGRLPAVESAKRPVRPDSALVEECLYHCLSEQLGRYLLDVIGG